MMEIIPVGKLPDFVEQEYIVVEFEENRARLNFQHLFDKGLRGRYKIVLEKIDD